MMSLWQFFFFSRYFVQILWTLRGSCSISFFSKNLWIIVRYWAINSICVCLILSLLMPLFQFSADILPWLQNLGKIFTTLSCEYPKLRSLAWQPFTQKSDLKPCSHVRKFSLIFSPKFPPIFPPKLFCYRIECQAKLWAKWVKDPFALKFYSLIQIDLSGNFWPKYRTKFRSLRVNKT